MFKGLSACLLTFALLGCTVPSRAPTPTPAGISARLNEPMTLKVGQWANLLDAKDTRIFFTDIQNDTPCPMQVNCDEIGLAHVIITVESGGKMARFYFSTDPPGHQAAAAFNGYTVQLVNPAPYPEKIDPHIAMDNYQVTLRVSEGTLNVSEAHFNEPFTLKLGQSVSLDDTGMQITFAEVTQDSRCPAHVLCADSGRAYVTILVGRDGANDSYALPASGDGFTELFPFARKVLVTWFVNALTPYPQHDFASKEIAPEEYQATLIVVNFAMPFATSTPQSLIGSPRKPSS